MQVFATLRRVLSEVDPDYKWPLEECDVHHFVWERETYQPYNNNGNGLPMEYREIPFHKGYLPRQLHNFMHAVLLPPLKPTMDVMQQRVDASKVASELFKVAQLAARYEQRPESFLKQRRKKWRSMSLDEGELLDTLIEIIGDLEDDYRNLDQEVLWQEPGLFDADQLQGPVHKVAPYLGKFVARSALNLNPYVNSGRMPTLAA